MTYDKEIREAAALIDQLVPDAQSGLPDDIFYLVSRLTPLINVDLLIVNAANEKLLTWREDRFYGPGWHIPGGIIRFKESIEQRIIKVAQHELNTTVNFDPTPVVITEIMNNHRDIRGHFISMCFKCQLTQSLLETERAYSIVEAKAGQWHWFNTMPDNIIEPHQRFKALFNSMVY